MESNLNIKEIVESIRQGNTQAAGELYEAHRAKGINIAMQRVKNRDDAEDMYQDAFLKALTNIEKFDNSKDFAPWLDTIIVNTCKNFLIKKRAVNFSDMSDEDNEFVDTLDSKDNETLPELSYDRKEFMEIMDGLLNELPRAQREAVTLFYYKEMSVKQIAELQDVPEDTVKSRLNYSRKKVGAAVEEYERKTGTKLYGALFVPLMYLLFYKKSVYAAEAEELLSGLEGAGDTVIEDSYAGKAAKGIGKATAEAAKRAYPVAYKIGIPIVIAVVVGTGAVAAISIHNNKADAEITIEVDDEEEIKEPNEIQGEQPESEVPETSGEEYTQETGEENVEAPLEEDYTAEPEESEEEIKSMLSDAEGSTLAYDFLNELDEYNTEYSQGLAFGFFGKVKDFRKLKNGKYLLTADHVCLFQADIDMNLPDELLEKYGLPIGVEWESSDLYGDTNWDSYGDRPEEEGDRSEGYFFHKLPEGPYVFVLNLDLENEKLEKEGPFYRFLNNWFGAYIVEEKNPSFLE